MIFNYKNTTVFYTDEGAGKPIILLHGFLENNTMWNDVEKELILHNRIITIDLLGHGKTACLGYIHSMELMAQVVSSILDSLKITKAIFIGHSMGAYVALALAQEFPEKIMGLCLLNSTSRADTKERKQNRDRAIAMTKTNYNALVSMSINNLFALKNVELFKVEINTIKTEALKTPIQGYVAAQEGMKSRMDRFEILKHINCPKLFIIGKQDPILKYNTSIEEAKATNSNYIVLSGGHMSYVENKQKLISSLKTYVSKF